MMKPVGWEKMNPVQLALFNARFQLAFLHGRKIKLTDDPNYEINSFFSAIYQGVLQATKK